MAMYIDDLFVGDQPKTAISHDTKSHTNITLDIHVDQQKQPIISN